MYLTFLWGGYNVLLEIVTTTGLKRWEVWRYIGYIPLDTMLAFYSKPRRVPKIWMHWGPPPLCWGHRWVADPLQTGSAPRYEKWRGQFRRQHRTKNGACDVTVCNAGKVSQRFLAIEKNSAVADKPRDAFVQMQRRGWTPKTRLSPYALPCHIRSFCIIRGWRHKHRITPKIDWRAMELRSLAFLHTSETTHHTP